MAKFTNEFINVSKNTNVQLGRIETAYSLIEKYFGNDWFERNKKDPKIIPNVLEMVLLGESIIGAEKVNSPRKLIKKLTNPVNQDDHSSGISEAQIIHRFTDLGFDSIQYEPQIKWFKKRPDITHRFNSDIIQYEITHIKLSAFDREMWTKRQTDLSGKLSSVVKYGSFDVYLLNEEMYDSIINKVVEESSRLLKDTAKEAECLIPGIAYLVFDPTGNVQLNEHKTSYPHFKEDGSMVSLAHDCVHDRSIWYKKMLGIKKITTCIAQITPVIDEVGIKKARIIRIIRPSDDKRITQKILNEAMQLSKKYAGIVVVDMGSASAKIDCWATLLAELFESKIYDFPSAVWLRSLQIGTRMYGWSETIVLNPMAIKKVPNDILPLLLKKNS